MNMWLVRSFRMFVFDDVELDYCFIHHCLFVYIPSAYTSTFCMNAEA